VQIKRNGAGNCGSSLSCLHESVEEVGRDTSPYDAFLPALVDCFFVAIFFETRCEKIREYAFIHVYSRIEFWQAYKKKHT
jgi:hypothetical protein